MFKHYFEQIQGIEIWPIISLTIFFSFFICLIIWVIKADHSYIQKMKEMPIDGKSETENQRDHA